MYWHQLIYGFRGFVGLRLQQFTFGLSKEFARLNYFGLVLVNMERLRGGGEATNTFSKNDKVTKAEVTLGQIALF